jgi:hypothetical protein
VNKQVEEGRTTKTSAGVDSGKQIVAVNMDLGREKAEISSRNIGVEMH